MPPIDPLKTRGYLNRNPGNLDRSPGEPWQGEIRDPNDPRLNGFQAHELRAGRFCVFAGHEWGIRAAAKNLLAYQRNGWDTINKAIDKWAPPIENDTAAYKARVAKSIGKGLDEPLDFSDYATAHATLDAIIRVECGGMPYQGKEIEDGLRLAGIVKPVKASSTAKATTVVAASTVVQPMVDSLQGPLKQAVDALAPAEGTNQVIDHILLGLKILLALLALGGAFWILRERLSRAQRDQKIDANPTVEGV